MFAPRNVKVGRGFPLPRLCYVFVLYSKMTWIKAQHWTFIYYMYLFFFCRSEWLFCNYWNSFSKKWPNEWNLWIWRIYQNIWCEMQILLLTRFEVFLYRWLLFLLAISVYGNTESILFFKIYVLCVAQR